ncbi:MAG: hypothetical protein U0166_24220 [Acidobacteriota bacterium]
MHAQPHSPEVPDEAAELLFQWRSVGLPLRLLLSLYLVGGSFSLYAGFLLTTELHHWAAWGVSLFILEPIGLFSMIALGALWAPSSAAAFILRLTIGRARRAAILVGVLVGLWLLFTLGFVAWEIVSMSL